MWANPIKNTPTCPPVPLKTRKLQLQIISFEYCFRRLYAKNIVHRTKNFLTTPSGLGIVHCSKCCNAQLGETA